MSEAAEEESGCSGTYEPEEGSSISQDDSDICRDLMERLRELEAENSALALANENQREAYERCLDEVANHVVQALLNQKDLREECIKLKKRVFDLEWQNRALSDLYQQKMQVTTGSLPQLKLQPVGEQNPNAPQGGVEASATSHALSFTAGHGQVNGERRRTTSSCLKTSPNSMDALSPFFKKKAQILEVLRKLEETDPLLSCPTALHHSAYRVPGQSALDLYAVHPKQTDSVKWSRHEPDILEYVNGEGTPIEGQVPECDSWMSCLLLAQNGLDDLFKWKHSSHTATVSPQENTRVDYSSISNKDFGANDIELFSQQYCQRKSEAHSSSSSSDDNGEVCIQGVMENHLCEAQISTNSEGKTGINQVLQNSESYFNSLKSNSGDGSLNGDLIASYVFDEKKCSSKDKRSDESNSGVCIMAAQQECLTKAASKVTHKHNSPDCLDQSMRQLIQTSAGENFLIAESSNDCDIWKVAETNVSSDNSLCCTTSHFSGLEETESSVAFSELCVENQTCNSILKSTEMLMVPKESGGISPSSNIAEKNSRNFLQRSSQVKKIKNSPTSPSGAVETKSSVSSPSKLLKFLKLPTGSEKSQNANHLRLSPQLTRNSKIPCRNNYEVYHSPLLKRKAILPEHDGQAENLAQNKSYHGMHSTFPLRSEDSVSLMHHATYSNNEYPSPKISRHITCGTSRVEFHSSESFGQQVQACHNAHNYENTTDISMDHLNRGATNSLGSTKGQKCSSVLTPHASLCGMPQVVSNPSSPLENLTVSNAEQPPSIMECHADLVAYQKASLRSRWQDTQTVPAEMVNDSSQSSHLHLSMKENSSEKRPSDSRDQCCETAQPVRRNTANSSSPKKTVSTPVGTPVKKQSDTAHLPFKERLTVIGKGRNVDGSQQGLIEGSPQPVRKEIQCNGKNVTSANINNGKNKSTTRQCEKSVGFLDMNAVKYGESTDHNTQLNLSPNSNLGRTHGQCCSGGICTKAFSSNSACSKMDVENNSSKNYVTKVDVAKNRVPGVVCSSGSPQMPRNSKHANTNQNTGKSVRSPHGSPTKLPSKSPTKVTTRSSVSRVTNEEPKSATQLVGTKPLLEQEEELKSQQLNEAKKNPGYPENVSQSYAKVPQPFVAVSNQSLGAILQSAIEEKVMKGIEENVLRLQVQDKGHTAEVKVKTSSGIASWFGLKKSKLPALNKRSEFSKGKDDKKEYNICNSPSSKEVKMAAKKLEMESFNISKLMEKAEDLSKALQEEKAYMNGLALQKQRTHHSDVIMEQTQNELQVTYSEVTTERFMQQLLNRVDEKEACHDSRMAQRNDFKDFQRVSLESKQSRSFKTQQNIGSGHPQAMEDNVEKHNVDLISKEDMTSDESLADSVTSQPFAACGSLTRTLDSGIGTFPLPDYSNNTAGKNIPKLKSKLEQPPVASSGKMSVTTKVPRKARTLEREVPNAEEPFVQAKDLSTPLLNAALQSSEAIFDHHAEKLCREDSYGDHIKQRRSQENKNWTFPNSKASGNTPDNFLCIPGDLQQLPDTSENVRPSTGDGKGHSAVASLSLQPSLSFTRRVSSRASSSKDLGQESVTEVNGSEVVQGMVSPQRHTPLETSESLSDSLYDSLSSCGSQG
ncbi:nck-associated protein 5-like isoform X2 [Protopterus annectens]|nr:nck-associated protein 5-like isoform X2 [Protopterus annectens]